MENHYPEIIKDLDLWIGQECPERKSFHDTYKWLEAYINDLILNDFNKLVQMLYRIDIDEAKLNYLIKGNAQTDACQLIAHLIIERLLEKIKSRKNFKMSSEGISEEEKW